MVEQVLPPISYSLLKASDSCPGQAKFMIDRAPQPPADERFRYNMLYGSVCAKAMEIFYRESMWKRITDKESLKKVVEELEHKVRIKFDEITKGITFGVKYKPLTADQMFEKVKKAITKMVAAILQEKVYGKYANSEVHIAFRHNGVLYKGFLDCLIVKQKEVNIPKESGAGTIRVEDVEITIIDGKSREDEGLLDLRQLLFYVFLVSTKFGKFADKVGYYFFDSGKIRYIDRSKPLEFKEKVEQVISWVDEKVEEIRGFIKEGKWEYRPSRDNCYFCAYKFSCPAYRDMRGVLKDDERKQMFESSSEEVSL